MKSILLLLRKPRRLLLAALAVVLGYGASFTWYPPDHFEAEAAATDSAPAPELTLNRLEGGNARLSDYRGKWVLLNFWATWCSPCVAEMPSMEEFSKKFKTKNMVVLAVSVDRGGPDKVKRFVKQYGLTFEIFHDPDSEASNRYGVSSLPSTFVINPKGEIVSQADGMREWNDPEIVAYFNDLMKRKK